MRRPTALAAGPEFAPPARWAALDRPLLALWGLASALLLARLGRQARGSRRAVGRWPERLVAGDPVRVADDVGPAVVGAVRPAVVIPAWALRDARLPLVLAHEWEHVRARDPLLLALASVACAVAPWSPAVWWQRRRLRDAVELDCDRRVLARSAADQTLGSSFGTHPGAAVGAYGRLLLDVAARAPRAAAVRLALTPRHASLRRRIDRMTAPRPPRLLAPLCAAGAALLAAFASGVPRPAAARGAAPGGPGAVTAERVRSVLGPAGRAELARPLGRSRMVYVTDSVGGRPRAAVTLVGQVPPGTPLRATSRVLSVTVRTFPPGTFGPDTVVVGWRRVDGGPRPAPTAGRPLTVVNGKIVSPTGPEARASISRDVEVVRPPESVARFGERGRDGALVYTTPAAHTRAGAPARDTTGADTTRGARGRQFRAVVRDSGRTEITPVDAHGRPTGPTVVRRTDSLVARHSADSVLVVVNGREVGRGEAAFGGVPRDSIAQVNVLRGELARARYGERGRNGVVEITTKAGAAKEQAPRAP